MLCQNGTWMETTVKLPQTPIIKLIHGYSWSGSSMCYLHETKQAREPEMQSQQRENQLEDFEKRHTSTPCLSKIKALRKFASIVAAVHGHPQADYHRWDRWKQSWSSAMRLEVRWYKVGWKSPDSPVTSRAIYHSTYRGERTPLKPMYKAIKKKLRP